MRTFMGIVIVVFALLLLASVFTQTTPDMLAAITIPSKVQVK